MSENLIKLIKEDIKLGKIELLKKSIHLLIIDEKTSLVNASIFSIKKGSNVHARENQLILSVASTDNIEMLEYVLNLGVPISNSGTDVRIATMKRNKKMVQQLVEKGALINIKNGKGYNAIMVAAMFENLEIVQYLLEEGANIEDVFNYFKNPLKDNNVIFIIDKKVSKNLIVNDWCLEYIKRKTLYQKLDEKLMKETDKKIPGKSKI